MRITGYWAFVILILPVNLYCQIVRQDIKINLDTNNIKFLKEFNIVYTLPPEEKVTDVVTTNYDFAKTSILLNLTSISNNTFTVWVKNFEISNFSIPRLKVKSIKGNSVSEFETPEISITQPPLGVSITNKAPIEDIFVLRDYQMLWIIILILCIVLGVVFFIFKWMNKEEISEKAGARESVDPYKEALNGLNQLNETTLNNDNYKEVFVRISEIVRGFLERVFPINALEMSTSEIKAYFKKESKKKPVLEEILEINTHIFKLCDRVKFAKHIPDEKQKRTAIGDGIRLVQVSKEIFENEAKPAEKEGGRL
jgi:hypothetical protein